MSDFRKLIVTTIAALVDPANKTKLADIKRGLTICPAPAGFEDFVPLVDKCRTKKQLAEHCEDALSHLPATSLLDEISVNVKKHISTITQSALEIGKLLAEARGEFDKQAEFVDWTKKEFGFGKSQAYRFLKINETFGEEGNEAFASCSMRVLDILSGLSPESLDKAKEKLEAGETIGTAEAKSIQESEKSDKESPKVKVTTETELEHENPWDIVGEAKEVPHVGQAEENLKPLKQEPVELPTQAAVPPSDPKESKEYKDLMELFKAQSAQLEQMRKDINRKVRELPMLPHFQSRCLLTRLGLDSSQSHDEKAIRAAARAITKVYTAQANEQVFELVQDARDTLIGNLHKVAA